MNPISHKETNIQMPSELHLSNYDAVAMAETVTPLESPKEVTQSIKKSEEIDWKSISLKALSFLAGAALGVLTGLAIAGTMVTPVGWAIAGGALAILLIGSIAYGGPKEFLHALKYALSGFAIGAGLGATFGINAAASAAGVSIKKFGMSTEFFGGMGAINVGGIALGACVLFDSHAHDLKKSDES
jgi:hypothetical protein